MGRRNLYVPLTCTLGSGMEGTHFGPRTRRERLESLGVTLFPQTTLPQSIERQSKSLRPKRKRVLRPWKVNQRLKGVSLKKVVNTDLAIRTYFFLSDPKGQDGRTTVVRRCKNILIKTSVYKNTENPFMILMLTTVCLIRT